MLINLFIYFQAVLVIILVAGFFITYKQRVYDEYIVNSSISGIAYHSLLYLITVMAIAATT